MIVYQGTIARDWFDWTNFTIGIVGLVLTVLAIIQATGAKAAARDAQKAVWKRTASAAFQELAHLGSQLDSQTGLQRFEAASTISRILRPKFSEARSNFGPELGSANQQSLAKINDQLELLSGWLSDSRVFDANLREAKAAAADSSAALSGIAGQLQQRER